MTFDLSKLSLMELGLLYWRLHESLRDNPECSGLQSLMEQVETIRQADPRYQKGLVIQKEAEENSGIEDGYCRPSDYYFAVLRQQIVERDYRSGKFVGYRETGESYVKLLLCFRWNWWLNGEAYNPDADGPQVRNFGDFITPEMGYRWHEQEEYTDDPEELRQQLLKAGLEEKPELIAFYKARCEAERKREVERGW